MGGYVSIVPLVKGAAQGGAGKDDDGAGEGLWSAEEEEDVGTREEECMFSRIGESGVGHQFDPESTSSYAIKSMSNRDAAFLGEGAYGIESDHDGSCELDSNVESTPGTGLSAVSNSDWGDTTRIAPMFRSGKTNGEAEFVRLEANEGKGEG